MIIGFCGFDFFLCMDVELHLLFKGNDRKILMAYFFHRTSDASSVGSFLQYRLIKEILLRRVLAPLHELTFWERNHYNYPIKFGVMSRL